MLEQRCDLLKSLHVPGRRPLALPNAWDAASARAVVAVGLCTMSNSHSRSRPTQSRPAARSRVQTARRISSSPITPS